MSAVTFRVPDREPVFIRHYSARPLLTTAAEAVGLINKIDDPRGYEIMVTRRIAPREIVRVRTLPKAIGWRYWPDAKGKPMTTCDCPACMPSGEVKAKRYRDRVKKQMQSLGYRLTEDL